MLCTGLYGKHSVHSSPFILMIMSSPFCRRRNPRVRVHTQQVLEPCLCHCSGPPSPPASSHDWLPSLSFPLLSCLNSFHLARTLPSHSLRLFLDCTLLAIGLGALCPTIDPSCWLSKPPYLLISSLLESQTHSGSRFSNNQSSSRAEQWKMGGFDCVSEGGVSERPCCIAAKNHLPP